MQVIIGIDPHKATHTAVAVSGDEDELARLKLRASRGQVDKLLTWAAPFPSRMWAIEGARGARVPPRATARHRWRNGRRCPRHVGGAHACARDRPVEQERSERRDVGRGDCVADT